MYPPTPTLKVVDVELGLANEQLPVHAHEKKLLPVNCTGMFALSGVSTDGTVLPGLTGVSLMVAVLGPSYT
jgi:hypothetical protein